MEGNRYKEQTVNGVEIDVDIPSMKFEVAEV